jgi:hypothetical protein
MRETTINRAGNHEHYCFAGQPAPCKGYFPNDVLPCVCGAEGDVVTALSQVAMSGHLVAMRVALKLALARPEPVEDKAA